jgi:hypothetical protein
VPPTNANSAGGDGGARQACLERSKSAGHNSLPSLAEQAAPKRHEPRSEMTRYPQDRASVLATTLISIVVRHLRAPEVHAEIAQTLREEFHDIARQARDETRPSGE